MHPSSYVGALYFLALIVLAIGIGTPQWLQRESSRFIPPADEAQLRERFSLWEYCVRVGGSGTLNGQVLPLHEECGAIDSDCRATGVEGSNSAFTDEDKVVVDDCDRFNAIRGSGVVAEVLVLLGIVLNATHRPYSAVLTGVLATVGASITLFGMVEESTSNCDTPREGFGDATCSLEWSFYIYMAGYIVLCISLLTQMACVRRIHNKASDY